MTKVWFRIDEQSIDRTPDKTPEAKGHRLIDALLAQVRKSNLPLKSTLNWFVVRVCVTGDTWGRTPAMVNSLLRPD